MTPVRRAALLYFLVQVVWGTFFPYYALALARDGLGPGTISQVLLIFPLAFMLAAPVAGNLADRVLGDKNTLHAVTILSAASFTGYFFVHGLAGHVLVTIAFAMFFVPAMALCDVIAVRTAREHGSDYGTIRVWGGIGFCMAAFGVGNLVDWLGVDIIYLVCAVSMTGAAIHGFSIPRPQAPRSRAEQGAGHDAAAVAAAPRGARSILVPLLASWAFFVAVAFYGAAHACYDAGITLYLTALGASGAVLGVAWGIAQFSEIIAFAVSGRILRRFGAHRLLMFIFLVAAVRWGVLALVSAPAFILLTQALHAITFGLFQPAVMDEAAKLGRGQAQNTAIGLVYACYGTGQAVGMSFTGTLLEWNPSALFGVAMLITIAALVSLAAHGARAGQRLH